MTGWTQTPNFIYDLMPDMKEAEIKVVMVIVRETIGWQRDSISLSLGDLQRLTKLSRPSVNTGIQDALRRGVLERKEEGQSFIYKIVEPNPLQEVVKNFNHSVEASKESLPEVVKNFDQELVKNFDSSKRNINTNTIKEGERSPAGVATLELQKAMYQAVCKVVGWDRKTIPKLDQQEAAETATILLNAGYVVEDMDRFLTEVWVHDWRWKKNRERPKPEQIREEIGKLRATLPEVMFMNGTGASPNGAMSEAKKNALITRAKTAQANIRTAEYTDTPVNPQWHKDIEAARGLT